MILIKGQTLHDYHNHILRIINRRISLYEEFKGSELDAQDWFVYLNLIEHDLDNLKEIKSLIISDWEHSNYSKTKK